MHGSREKPNAIRDGESGAYCTVGLVILSIVLCVTNTTIQPVWGDFLSRNEQICGLILFKLIKMLQMRKQVTNCDLVFAKVIEM